MLFYVKFRFYRLRELALCDSSFTMSIGYRVRQLLFLVPHIIWRGMLTVYFIIVLGLINKVYRGPVILEASRSLKGSREPSALPQE